MAVVILAGLCTLGVFAVDWARRPQELRIDEFWVIVALLVVAELRPITVPRRTGQDQMTLSTTFAFALLLSFGVAPAVVAYAMASVVADAVDRKRHSRLAFNVAQYTLSLAAAGVVLTLLSVLPEEGSQGHIEALDLPAVLAAAAIFFGLNNFLAGTAQALSQEAKVFAYLRDDFTFQVTTAMLLVALSPVVLVVADHSLAFLPLLMLPIIAIEKGGRQAAINAHQALHDGLTGLPNRELFGDRLQQALAVAEREGTSVATMLMDLDRFKEINDTLGHYDGDLLLKEVAGRLRAALRESDTVARLGGDEFGVVLSKTSDALAAAKVAQELLQALEEPIVVRGFSLDIGASIGIAAFPAHGHDVETLMQRADVAMYSAKEARSGCEIYAAERDPHSAERLLLVGQLRRAIEAGDLVLHYQPKVDLQTGAVAGAEALVRWQHHQRGFIPPDDFVPLAERTGLIRPLTMHVLAEAAGQCRAWREGGLELSVAVNLSAHILVDRHLPGDIERLLRQFDLPASALELEITESAIMADPARALAVLERLSGMGLGLSIDDFGTGYSSLGYLKRLPVDEIKIDKSFVMNMASDRADAAIVRSTIELAHNLELTVVAEGVEDEVVLGQLRALGCNTAQGYHFSRPLAAPDLGRWVQERSDRTALVACP